ncbi:hypothetical protein GEV33_007594 [Tenebrio molitor]|uniref:CUB domain-containing protein n=1 Tax=Tenebrio molitor TaxID=7067 RepID=A0A8J6LIP1_TENMO|nr:hypothetical protein GEV33_007594 [Tenebrio molitor]
MCGISLILVFIAVIVVNASQNNISARNFNSDCGQVFTKREFIIESARYPSNYPPNYECSYLVKGPTCPTRFTLQFIDFSLEDSLGCSKDRLEVDTKDALCGNKMGIKEYFSEKGTLILRFVSDADITGRGYRILLTRSPCESQQPLSTTTQTVPKWYTTNNEVEYTTTSRPAYDKSKGKCCQTSYSVKKFTLTSPNFPYSMSTPAECVYHIYKTNRKICRLRIDVQFFWSGRPSNNCPEGYLEIDGKRICGCKSDLKLLMSFEGDSPKILRFVSRGYERNSYSGFVMEIVQDECPKKYVPEESQKNATAEKKFRFYNDQINRIAWPNKSHETVIERLHLISENTEIIDDKNDSDSPPQPQIVRHVYFFSYPDLNRIPRDREETEYVDISSMDSIFVQDNVDYGYCLNWNRKQFSSLSSRSLPVCKINEGNVAAERCVELNQVRGSFKSPGYPFYYRGNMNICYRFNKSPGYCSVRVYMKDFDLQNGVTCENDYLLFANKLRYCGSRLSNTISIVDLRHKPQEQMNFVTDAFYCGRGFYGSYEQIPCQDSSYPINPTTPPNVPKPMTPCSREIQDEMFTFDVYDYNGPSCLLTIRKHREAWERLPQEDIDISVHALKS